MKGMCSLKKKIHAKTILSVLAGIIAGIAIFAGGCIYVYNVCSDIPQQIYVVCNQDTTIDLNVPVVATADAGVDTSADLSKPFTVKADTTGDYELALKLFGIIPLPSVNVCVVDEKYLYPGGFQVGLYLKTEGIYVAGTGEFKDSTGNMVCPGMEAVQAGDYITAVDGSYINYKYELNKYIQTKKEEPVVLTVKRDSGIFDTSVTPVRTDEGDYKVGIWVKDDAQGIGTLTYIDSDNNFAALGHGISANQSQQTLSINSGSLYNTRIVSIVKGQKGTPGEFIGTIDYKGVNRIGNIEKNSVCGVFGSMTKDMVNEYGITPVKVGFSQEVHKGKAYIRMYADGGFKDYEIKIIGLSYSSDKNITLKVVSDELIDKTNGVVQGMSGCPIIQDDKIVGAVTHVFIDDPSCGYGIFIENMLPD